MNRPVQWSRAALDDLKAQISHISGDNPAAALRVADHIRSSAAALGKLATGRPGRIAGIYEKSVIRLPYGNLLGGEVGEDTGAAQSANAVNDGDMA